MTDINKVVEKYNLEKQKLEDGFMSTLARLKAVYERKWQNAFDAQQAAEFAMDIAQDKLNQIKNLEVK